MMNTEACRTLLTDAWYGVTADCSRHAMVDHSAISKMDDEEILTWTGKIISGDAVLAYTYSANDVIIPVLN